MLFRSDVFTQLKSQNLTVDYSTLYNSVSADCSKTLAQIIARNADIIITAQDVQYHIDTIKTAKLLQNEAKEFSAQQLAARIERLKEKKK